MNPKEMSKLVDTFSLLGDLVIHYLQNTLIIQVKFPMAVLPTL